MTNPTTQPRHLDPAKPLLLIGVGGMLWRAWANLLDTHRLIHIDPDLTTLDLTKPDTLDAVLGDGHCYSAVINCAAYTAVDNAEKDEPLARAINATGVGQLARRCAALSLPLVHYSTDYVFAGNGCCPYPVDTRLDPLNAYGRTKAEGEQLIRAAAADHLIIRTSWLYAPWGNNFVRTIAKLAREKPQLKVVSDQRGRPTSAEHLAATSFRLLTAGARGTYHVTDGGECSWFDFARQIAQLTNAPCDVQPCSTDQYPRPAKRPAYSVLDLSRTEALVGPMPPWQDNLAHVISRLE